MGYPVTKPSQVLPADADGMLVAVDTEGSGLHADDGARVSIVSVAWWEDGEAVSWAFPFDQGPRDKLPSIQLDLFEMWDENLPQEEWVWLLGWLGRQRLIMHGAKHDLHQLAVGTRHWAGEWLAGAVEHDTMLFQYLVDPTELQALKATVVRLGLANQDEKDALDVELARVKKRYRLKAGDGKRYDLADWDVIGPYAAADTSMTLKLRRYQMERLSEGELRIQYFRREMRLLRALFAMERRGIGFDTEECMRGAAALRKRERELKGMLPFTTTLPGAKKYFFETVGLKPPDHKRTGTGAYQLDDEVMDRFIKQGVKWMAEFYELTRIQKALSMWYEGYPSMIGDDGRLRTNFKQTRVKSGRMSVERIQLQAIPKGDKAIDLPGVTPVKQMFRAREGYVLVNLDMSQAELRVATSTKIGAKCEGMRDLLAGGADLHGITTEKIFGLKPGDPDFKYKRDIAKRLTFGGIFQIGGKRFQETLSKLAGIDASLADCERDVAEWRKLYPEFGRAYYRYMKQAEAEKRIKLVGDEWAYFGPRDYPNTAWNRRVQGSLAKANKMWLARIEEKWPGVLVLNVHDSAVLELPIETHREVAQEVQEDGAAMLTRMFETRKRDGYDMLVDFDYFLSAERTTEVLRGK